VLAAILNLGDIFLKLVSLIEEAKLWAAKKARRNLRAKGIQDAEIRKDPSALEAEINGRS
jgi:hypothetical protein